LAFILNSSFRVLQASFLDCQFLDVLPFSEYGFSPAEVDIGWRDVLQALVVSAVVVVIHKGFDHLTLLLHKG
jgi:hypothetical protein